ncbi:MAG: S-layer homology domain-containing protein, partial [Clostridia bacterium]|nr:S-layer homology domain-containing protein [Clostridia bacterium]
YRYATRCGYDTAPRADLSGYTDKGEIATWAEDALSWANAIGLIKGRTATTIDPKATASRAELATMLHRFCEKFDI